jgi:hypothetical protein
VSLRPAIANDGEATLIAYETDDGGYKTVTVELSQAGGPFIPEVIASTTREDSLDVLVLSDGAKVWAVWVDSETHLGWSERDGSGWTAPSYEPYAGEADIDRARLRIKGQAIR